MFSLLKKSSVANSDDGVIYRVTATDVVGVTWPDRTLEYKRREDARKYKQSLRSSTAGLTATIWRIEYSQGKIASKTEVW